VSDPHVVALHYRFVSVNEHDRFGTAVPFTFTANGFDMRLAEGILDARPHDDFATEQEARAALEPFLADWVAQARLEQARRQIRFDFDDAEIVDRVSDGNVVVRPGTARLRAMAFDAVVVVDNSRYPAPPNNFRTDPVLDSILARLGELDAKRTSLTDAANWVLTKVEHAFGGPPGATKRRRTAARTLALREEVLSNLGRLADQNDPQHGRKANRPEKPFTAAEQEWLRAAIVLIARQVGAINSGATLVSRSMTDLPAIP
jgi:hypothetical protein